MSAHVQFKINGRTVSPSQIGQELKKAVHQKVATTIESRVASNRCPVHGLPASVRRLPTTDGKFEFSVRGCCQEHIDRIRRSLGAR